MLFQLGPLTFDSPGGLNPQETEVEFGGDFAVKPVVGAEQPREFVGPGEHRRTLTGKIYPFRQAAAGVSSGLDEITLLENMAYSGEPQILVRGDGSMLGFYVIEKGSVRHANLGRHGVGREVEFRCTLVRSPSSPSIDSLISVLDMLFQ